MVRKKRRLKQKERKIPPGIRIWAHTLMIWYSVILIVLPFSLFLILTGDTTMYFTDNYAFNLIYSIVTGGIIIIESIFFIALGRGILRLEEGARDLLIKLILFIIFFNIIDLAFLTIMGIDIVFMLITFTISCMFYFVIIAYFNRHDVRAAFKK